MIIPHKHIMQNGETKELTKYRAITVWYSPKISVNNQPSKFHGLSGLILEVNDGDLTLVCSKIVINPKRAC
ncbi:hypothetical protein [Gelatiniphilus marinus]